MIPASCCFRLLEEANLLYTEDNLFPLSALQHYLFCPRQCALIHSEQQWTENQLTAEGRILHERVHELQSESRGRIVTARGLRLSSFRLGLTGQADAVEFHRTDGSFGAELPNRKGQWSPIPVEYKRGRPKKDRSDEVQVCAQALCLEEMLGVDVEVGYLFYGKTKRRTEVFLSKQLRGITTGIAEKVHELFTQKVMPAPQYSPKCNRCSMFEICVPQMRRTTGYVGSQLRRILRSDEEDV